ncbi:hypothetical protein CPBF1521_35920 [Xanthomonas arboricola pv. juglandis]|nr:hypothetical protein CPBF1521_35920 [Xanthomonas arboricola pv. juglandis]SYZ61852.1 hypothetical protein CPBF427_40510 [Xanthomonas arboricola pv. juglandis]
MNPPQFGIVEHSRVRAGPGWRTCTRSSGLVVGNGRACHQWVPSSTASTESRGARQVALPSRKQSRPVWVMR